SRLWGRRRRPGPTGRRVEPAESSVGTAGAVRFSPRSPADARGSRWQGLVADRSGRSAACRRAGRVAATAAGVSAPAAAGPSGGHGADRAVAGRDRPAVIPIRAGRLLAGLDAGD